MHIFNILLWHDFDPAVNEKVHISINVGRIRAAPVTRFYIYLKGIM